MTASQLLAQHSGAAELVTAVEQTPRPETRVPTPTDVNITWLLQHVDPQAREGIFRIDRRAASCRTPRRNDEVEAALAALAALSKWATSLHKEFQLLDLAAGKAPLRECVAHAPRILVPVLPFLRRKLPSKSSSKDLAKHGTECTAIDEIDCLILTTISWRQ